MLTTVYLIRHAEADGNVYRRIHGQYNGLITPRGYCQIQCLADRFKSKKIDAVYASDLFRTCETARAISDPRGLGVTTCPNLREIAFGPWEDIPWGEAFVNHNKDYMTWEKHPQKFKLDGSENYIQMYTRARYELDRIIAQNPNRTVAVISHGTVIRALLCMITIGDMDRVSEISWCENTGVAKIISDDSGNLSVEYCNDGNHLDNLTTVGRQRWWTDDVDPGICNLHFVPASFPEDLDRADGYYHDSWCALFDERTYNSQYTRSRLKKAQSSHDNAVVFARQGNGTEVGMVALDTRTKLIPNSGHIMLIYLAEKYRGAGYGAQLLGHAVSIYRSFGLHWVTVRAAANNTRALKFYEKFGFEEFGAEQSENSRQLLLRKCIAATPRDIIVK